MKKQKFTIDGKTGLVYSCAGSDIKLLNLRGNQEGDNDPTICEGGNIGRLMVVEGRLYAQAMYNKMHNSRDDGVFDVVSDRNAPREITKYFNRIYVAPQPTNPVSRKCYHKGQVYSASRGKDYIYAGDTQGFREGRITSELGDLIVDLKQAVLWMESDGKRILVSTYRNYPRGYPTENATPLSLLSGRKQNPLEKLSELTWNLRRNGSLYAINPETKKVRLTKRGRFHYDSMCSDGKNIFLVQEGDYPPEARNWTPSKVFKLGMLGTSHLLAKRNCYIECICPVEGEILETVIKKAK